MTIRPCLLLLLGSLVTSAENPYQRRKGNQRLLQEGDGSTDLVLLKQKLLEDYKKSDFPFVPGRSLTVEFGLNIHRVVNVDVRNAVIDLIVWCRQAWVDPRLVVNDTNFPTVHFWIDQGSGVAGTTSEIWTPDLELWNLDESLSTSLTDAYARLTPTTGHIYWSRPGHLKPVCRFKGLQHFPYDELECSIEIGSWSYSGLKIQTKLMDGVGISTGGSETAGESFAEFAMTDVRAEVIMNEGWLEGDAKWPVLLYTFTFRRASGPYVRGHIALLIILSVANFCCFWLPPQGGERMGLAITSMLAAIASENTVAAFLPSADTLTWFDRFRIVSMLFTAFALFESAVVIYFYYYTGDDLVPRWVKWLVIKDNPPATGDDLVPRWVKWLVIKDNPPATGDDLVPRWVKWLVIKDNPPASDRHVKSVCEVTTGSHDDGQHASVEDGSKVSVQQNATDTQHHSESDQVRDEEQTEVSVQQSATDTNHYSESALARDEQQNATDTNHHSESALARDEQQNATDTNHHSESDPVRDEEHTEVSVQQTATDTNHHSESNEVIDDNNYSTSRVEPQSAVHPILGQDAVDSSDCQETENEYRWRKVSAAADEVSRVVVPAAYAAFVCWTISTRNMRE